MQININRLLQPLPKLQVKQSYSSLDKTLFQKKLLEDKFFGTQATSKKTPSFKILFAAPDAPIRLSEVYEDRARIRFIFYASRPRYSKLKKIGKKERNRRNLEDDYQLFKGRVVDARRLLLEIPQSKNAHKVPQSKEDSKKLLENAKAFIDKHLEALIEGEETHIDKYLEEALRKKLGIKVTDKWKEKNDYFLKAKRRAAIARLVNPDLSGAGLARIIEGVSQPNISEWGLRRIEPNRLDILLNEYGEYQEEEEQGGV